jgi:TolA-binding protein
MTSARNSSRLVSFLAALLLSTISLLAQKPGSATEEAFNDAQGLYHNGKLPEALAAFQQFESQYQLSASVTQAMYLQGWCWIGLHKYREAAEVFGRLVKSYPIASIVPEAMLKEAECYRELKNYPQALDIYHQFETQYPQHKLRPQALLGMAWALFQQGDQNTAKNIAQKVRSQFPDDNIASVDALFLLGQILTVEKNYDEADKLYQQIPSQTDNPRIAENLYLAGEAMFDARRYTNAIAYYERVQSDPDLRASAAFRIANCYQLVGRLDEAITDYRQFLKTWPDNQFAEQAQFAFIQVLTERHEPTDAESESRVFQEKYPNSPFATDVLFLRAEALFASGRFQESLDRFQKFAAAGKNAQLLETADFRIAACYYGLHDFSHARDNFIAVMKKHPNSKLTPDALFRLGRSYFEISRQATDPATIHTNLVDAINNYEIIRARFANSESVSEVTFQLGHLYTYLSPPDLDKAVARFQEFVNRWPGNGLVPEALYQIARNQFAQSQFAAAIATYQQLIDKYPDGDFASFAVYGIVDSYRKAKNSNDVYATLNQFTAQKNANVRIAAATSIIELALDENDAQRAYAAAVKLLVDPEKNHLPAASYVAVGDAMLRYEHFAQARDAYQKFLTLYPNDTRTTPHAQIGIGKASLALNQLNDAEKAFDQVIATNPHDPDAELGLAKIYLARGSANLKTVDLLNNVMANAKGNNTGEAAFLLAGYFLNLRGNEKENTKTALAYYLRASLMISGPDGEEAAFHTAQCHKALGDVEAARSAFQAYLRRFPNGKLAADAKQELASL